MTTVRFPDGLGIKTGRGSPGTNAYQGYPEKLVRQSLSLKLVDVLDHIADALKLLRLLIRDLISKLFFERHHQFDRVKRISTQIVNELRFTLDIGFVHAQLLGDDFLDAQFNRFHLVTPSLFKRKFASLAQHSGALPQLDASLAPQRARRVFVGFPFGGGGGKVLFLGPLPVNLQAGAYWYAVKPDFGPDWQLRLQAQFMFPGF